MAKGSIPNFLVSRDGLLVEEGTMGRSAFEIVPCDGSVGRDESEVVGERIRGEEEIEGR